jgi:indole-3-glycerol phosphate synthase
VVIGTDCIGICKSNYHTITATKAPFILVREPQLNQDNWKIVESGIKHYQTNKQTSIKVYNSGSVDEYCDQQNLET